MGPVPLSPGEGSLSEAAPWQRMSPRARRAILLTSFLPPAFVVFIFTPAYLLYLGHPTEANLALLVTASVALFAVAIGLILRTLRILRHEPPPPRQERPPFTRLVRFAAVLLAFGAAYLGALIAVAFGLQALDESSEAGAIATTLILLAVMFGVPIAFYVALKALGFTDRWTT